MRNLWSILGITGIALQLLLIRALLRGALKLFPFFFTYVVGLFLITAIDASAFFNRDLSARANRYYWALDATLQGLIFLFVISLIYGAMDRSEKRATVRRTLVGGALLFVCVSLYFTWDPRLGRWMTQLGRNLGFLAVILNLVLWAVLLQFRRTDRTMLMLSGGLGIQMAGKAIGHSLRDLSRSTIVLGDLIYVLSNLLCLYIWWEAFRHFDQNAPPDTTS
jgi:hypothetical protein